MQVTVLHVLWWISKSVTTEGNGVALEAPTGEGDLTSLHSKVTESHVNVNTQWPNMHIWRAMEVWEWKTTVLDRFTGKSEARWKYRDGNSHGIKYSTQLISHSVFLFEKIKLSSKSSVYCLVCVQAKYSKTRKEKHYKAKEELLKLRRTQWHSHTRLGKLRSMLCWGHNAVVLLCAPKSCVGNILQCNGAQK